MQRPHFFQGNRVKKKGGPLRACRRTPSFHSIHRTDPVGAYATLQQQQPTFCLSPKPNINTAANQEGNPPSRASEDTILRPPSHRQFYSSRRRGQQETRPSPWQDGASFAKPWHFETLARVCLIRPATSSTRVRSIPPIQLHNPVLPDRHHPVTPPIFRETSTQHTVDLPSGARLIAQDGSRVRPFRAVWPGLL